VTHSPAPSPLLFGEAHWEATGALRWLSPALIGLCGPIAVGLALFPGAMDHARSTLTLLLFTLLVVCVIAYIVSVVSPGDVVSLLVDRQTRVVDVLRSGLFASRVQTLAFDEIADLKLASQYDDDGYAYQSAALHLVDGTIIALPASLSAADVSVVRRALGLDLGQRRGRRPIGS
jgi:hypothetical protein